jgi:hypothetical protein
VKTDQLMQKTRLQQGAKRFPSAAHFEQAVGLLFGGPNSFGHVFHQGFHGGEVGGDPLLMEQ